MEQTQAAGPQARSSSGTARSHGSRSTNPDKQISQIEKSVTHLLVATKQLLETLTQWSRGNAQEEEVSDVYVRLGYEFNLACRAFNSIGVETSDLGPVPDLLRSILEDTLSQPASPQALDNYLPRIRDIIINLLHGLKRKQSKLRSRPSKDGPSKPPGAPPRQSSIASVQSNDTTLIGAPENLPSSASARSDSRLETLRFSEEPPSVAGDIPPTTSLNRNSFSRQSQKSQSKPISNLEQPVTATSSSAQPVPSISLPSTLDRTLPSLETPFPHAPPPPPKQDALTALQRGPDLERRASRRFSAYQIQKHLGASPNGVPVIPTAQNSPIPNRGREVRESLTAVRSRTSFQTKKSASRLQEISPSRGDAAKASNRISEERDEVPTPSRSDTTKVESLEEASGSYSPTIKTPDEYVGGVTQPILGATMNGPMSPPGEFQGDPGQPVFQVDKPKGDAIAKTSSMQRPTIDVSRQQARAIATPSPTAASNLDVSPPQGKELTLFLQYKSKIKKFVLPEGFEGLTMARLQLAFIEKFAWNTHNNGVDLPEIYVQDPVSGVRHELEDLSDVKDRSVLVLNVEVLDEVKKHFDDSIGGLRSTLEGVRSLLDGQGSMLQRFSDRQLETSKEMARISSVPTTRPSRTPTIDSSTVNNSVPTESSLAELQYLRRDIAVLRQTYSTMSTDFAATMSEIKAKAAVVKEAASATVAPSYEGDAGRSHVNQGKKQLNTDSEALVNRVDDLTDVVEDLRKDVVTRGVRPLPRQLEDISKEVTSTSRQLNKVREFLKREKPVWTKIWENELNQVCTERDDLTQQEELISDLEGDLQDVTSVFQLVEEAMKQQTLQPNNNPNLRNSSKQFDYDPTVDPQAAKDGMLGEVRALRPNHESRLQAIERAEKLRQKELENRDGGVFQREVKEFVEEGKLKKTGGMDEVERLRKVKDERAMKENWERQQAREAEKERKRQAEAASKAAAQASAKEQEQGSKAISDTPQEAEAAASVSVIDSTFQEPSIYSEQAPNPSTTTAHESNTLNPQEQSEAGRSSPQPGRESPSTDANQKHESSPPRLPEFDLGGSDNKEEVKATESGLSKSPSKDSSWWKPAIF